MTIGTAFLPATVTIPDLPLAGPITGAELMEAVQTTNSVANSVQLTVTQILSGITTSNLPGPYQTGNLTAFGLVYGNGTSALGATAAGTTNYLTVGQGTVVAPKFQSVATSLDLGIGSTSTTVLFRNSTTWLTQSLATTLDLSVGSTQTTVLFRNSTTWFPLSVSTTLDFGIGNTQTTIMFRDSTHWVPQTVSLTLDVTAGSVASSVLYRTGAAWISQSIATSIDLAIGSTASSILYRSGTTWLAQSLSTSIDLAIGSTASSILYRTGTTWLSQTPTQVIDAAIGNSQGNILYRNAASWVVLTPGTNGQLLQTQGAGANPQWAGGMVLLNTLLPSGIATSADTTSLTSAYRNYLITFDNVAPVASAVFQMQIATTGTAFLSGGYVSLAGCNVNATTTLESSTTVLLLSGLRATTLVGSTISYGVSGFLRLFHPAGTVERKQMIGDLTYLTNAASGTAALARANVNGYFDTNTNPVVSVQFSFSAGNIATGTIKVYGLL